MVFSNDIKSLKVSLKHGSLLSAKSGREEISSILLRALSKKILSMDPLYPPDPDENRAVNDLYTASGYLVNLAARLYTK